MLLPTNFGVMKKYLLIVLIIGGLSGSSFAQDGGRLEALKIAYITKKLNLSTEEAQKFWPIYNKYTEELRAVKMDQKSKKLSEIDTEDKILQIRKKYNTEFSNALSAEKINNFFRSERDFGVFIQRELQERRLNNQQLQRPFKQ
jgi:diphthamide synthase subunit DPH2